MKVISITNQKGGVAKSTTTQNVGAELIRKGYRVLFIDLDAQGNLSYCMSAKPVKTIYGVLTGEATAAEAITHTQQGDIIASSPMLSAADATLTDTGKEYKLREALETIQNEYDFVLIDTPPALNILTINALTAAQDIIIPAQADIFSLQGISELQKTIATVRKYCNPALTVRGIVFTRYNQRATLTREITEYTEQIAQELGTKVYDTKIREGIAIKEAQVKHKNIFDYDESSNGAADYAALTAEILKDYEQ